MPEDRRKLTAWLSPTSYEAWQTLAEREGTTMTAILELLGPALLTRSRFPAPVAEVIAEARTLSSRRRRRDSEGEGQ